MAEWRVERGDCIKAMAIMPEASVDAIVCDPPYGLEFMGKSWDRLSGGEDVRQPFRGEVATPDNPYGRTPVRYGYDSAPKLMQEWHEAWGREALRVLKPGGHLLAFGGTRTYHRLACAIEDAGFEVRDCLVWLYGSGFPKSLDVSKAIDKAAGADREDVGPKLGHDGLPTARLHGPRSDRAGGGIMGEAADGTNRAADRLTLPATPDAERWQGWGTALKPAHEPIILARKPLEGTVAGNVLAHGTGALNVDGCRVGKAEGDRAEYGRDNSLPPIDSVALGHFREIAPYHPHDAGRWPANVLLDPKAAALLDEQSGTSTSRVGEPRAGVNGNGWGPTATSAEYDDMGGASRFFYCAKASSAERNAGLDGFKPQWAPTMNGGIGGLPHNESTATPKRNIHPTVKPIDLMRWLVRLVTPPGGVVLDPFTGSGTTGCAAVLEGFEFVGIEREPEYADIAEARIRWWAQHPEEVNTDAALDAGRERDRVADTGQLGLLA